MTEKMTEIKALEAAIYLVNNAATEDDAFNWTAVQEKLEIMLATRKKPRNRKPDNSKKLANIALGEQFAANFDGETFKARDVADSLGVSVAKASAICKAMGWEKVPSTEKVAVYSL